MSDEPKVDLEALEVAEKSATPGPWFAVLSDGESPTSGFGNQQWGSCFTFSDESDCAGWITDSGFPDYGIKESDARLVALMRNNLAPMIAELRAAREVVEAAREYSETDHDGHKCTPGWQCPGCILREKLAAYAAAAKKRGK